MVRRLIGNQTKGDQFFTECCQTLMGPSKLPNQECPPTKKDACWTRVSQDYQGDHHVTTSCNIVSSCFILLNTTILPHVSLHRGVGC
jgi:hypothetical protein